MRDRAVIFAASIFLVAAAATAVGVTVTNPDAVDTLREQLPGENSEQQPESPDDDTFIHKHAHLFFLVDGERKNLSSAYMERDRHVHFHHDDGIIHVEGDDADVSAALETLNITINESCARYGLDDATYCGGDGTELRFSLNGENVTKQDWLNHTIQQGDSIVLYHGDAAAPIPDTYLQPLPSDYTPGYDRL